MRTSFLFALAATGFAMIATASQARLASAHLPPPDDSVHIAVHLPTGCQAEVILDGGRMVRAQITDPACLPRGVRARAIPGTLIDFTVRPQ